MRGSSPTGSLAPQAKRARNFFTIATADESVFYLVIVRKKDGETVYFLFPFVSAVRSSLFPLYTLPGHVQFLLDFFPKIFHMRRS